MSIACRSCSVQARHNLAEQGEARSSAAHWARPKIKRLSSPAAEGEPQTQAGGGQSELEFIARLVLHIPDVREQQVLYYGVYANASRRLPHGRAEKNEGDGPGGRAPWTSIEEPGVYQRRQRIRWAQLIRRVWAEDPPPGAGKLAESFPMA